MALSQPAFIELLIVPLMTAIGHLWRDGTLRMMHEHLATAVVRTVLWGGPHRPDRRALAPILVVTMPVGQWHELGALIVASTAAAEGCNVSYLGTNLPAAEIAAAAQHIHAKAVALSLVYPADDPRVGEELRRLRRDLGRDIDLLIGGTGSTGYPNVVDEIDAVCLRDLSHFRTHPAALRTGSPRSGRR